jgi:agmatine deiminase
MQRASRRFVSRHFMPAESSLHQRTLMAWPTAPLLNTTQLLAARSEVVAIANAISRFEPVTLFASPGHTSDLRSQVTDAVNISNVPVDDLWIRDSGPVFTFSSNRSIQGVDFGFNYWGNKFPHGEDINLAQRILALANIPRIDPNIRAEGGALEVDGEGTLLATESSLINPNRNPGMTKADIEDQLKCALGVDKVIWLRGVKDVDCTDCHIDALARFASPETIILSRPHSSRPRVWTEVYEDAKRVLQQEQNSKGRAFQLVDIQEPDIERLRGEDDDMVASYANYYLPNGAVIIPRFGDDIADQQSANIFQELFPDREVVQVRINFLPRLGGGIHCATQQQPRTDQTK